MKPVSYFKPYAEKAYDLAMAFQGSDNRWKDLHHDDKQQFVIIVMSVFQELGVNDEDSGEFYVDEDWSPETVMVTLDDLLAKYTGDVNTLEIQKGDASVYDFIWEKGNEYVVVTNVFLEDAEPQYVTFDGKTLELKGDKHQFVLEFVEEYPDLDVKVFKKVSESKSE